MSVHPQRATAGEEGFSVVEVLIAAGIFLIIAIGILPLFMTSMRSNMAGNEYMQAVNHGRSGLESFHQKGFESADLTLAAGQTEKLVTDWYLVGDPTRMGDETWTTTPDAAVLPPWRRTTSVRQYSVTALNDLNLQDSDALAGGTDDIFVHLKEIRVRMQGARAEGLGSGGKGVTLRVLKAF